MKRNLGHDIARGIAFLAVCILALCAMGLAGIMVARYDDSIVAFGASVIGTVPDLAWITTGFAGVVILTVAFFNARADQEEQTYEALTHS